MAKPVTDFTPSKFVEKCVGGLAMPRASRVLDLACGFGRHAAWLAAMGHRVVAVDIDEDRIRAARRTANQYKSMIEWVVSDVERPLPIDNGSFDAVIVVHYYSAKIIAQAYNALRPGGHFILETFGAQGENWRSLPLRGEVSTLSLSAGFEIIRCEERAAGPKSEHAVVRALAQRQALKTIQRSPHL